MLARTLSRQRPTSLKVCDGMWLMWLAPGIELPRCSAPGLRKFRAGRRFGGVNVEVAGARMADVARQHAFEHGVNPLHFRILEIAVAVPGLEQKQRLGVQRRRIQIVRIPLGQSPRRIGPGPILYTAGLEIVIGHIADRKRIDIGLLARAGLAAQLASPADCRIRIRRVGRPHVNVQIRTPGPCFAPKTDGALGVGFLRFAERAHGFVLGESVHELKALIKEGLRAGFSDDILCEKGPSASGM